jgi:hypothetical protein
MVWKAPTPAGGYFLKINNNQQHCLVWTSDHKLLLFQCWIISAKSADYE